MRKKVTSKKWYLEDFEEKKFKIGEEKKYIGSWH